jgi:hypothetical protein
VKTISLAQAGVAVEKLEEQLRKAALKGLYSSAAKGKQVIVTQIIPSRTPQPVDRGVYRAGWRFVKTPNGADIWNAESHASHIEYGVRAENVKIGRSMIHALTMWAIRKGIVAKTQVKSALTKKTKKIVLESDAVKIAWAIARAMKKRGIFGKGTGLGILTELVEKRLSGIIKEEVERELAAVSL